MNTFKKKIKAMAETINFDGLRCFFKGDPSIREILGALNRQKEIDQSRKDRIS